MSESEGEGEAKKTKGPFGNTYLHCRELEQLQNEKRKALVEHEHAKLSEIDERLKAELRDWREQLVPRKQVCTPSFRFYFQHSLLRLSLSVKPLLRTFPVPVPSKPGCFYNSGNLSASFFWCFV